MAGCTPGAKSHLKSEGFSILSNDDPASKKWSNYLYENLHKRAQDKSVLLQKEKEGFMPVYIIVDQKQEYDYSIDCKPESLTLKAKSGEVMRWLIYQLIEEISNYNEYFISSDLPPAILDFHNRNANFDFSYREPHFQSNLRADEYSDIIGTHSVDNDWGIWGHNLNKAISDKNDNSIYARHGKQIIKEQFCFSGDGLYNQLVTYIIDNFGDSKDYIQRFMIMPNDNDYVCECEKCASVGNTSKNTTPALSALIKRLASRFPYHRFFTAAYITTVAAPDTKWPENTGVMISTIDIPRGVKLDEQKEVKRFLKTLDEWKKCTSNIYIWDYAANFDDYLTPIPVLGGLKRQLKFYKTKGVKGVFLNANGYDYSSFDDMKTYVAANLMIDTSLSVDTLCRNYFEKFYPVSGKLLSDYYLSLENRIKEIKKPYNMYGGFPEAMNTYLDIDEFISFYNELATLIPNAEEKEGEKLKKLFVALTFTRLQIAYYQKDDKYGFANKTSKGLALKPEINEFIKRLSQHSEYKDMTSYKEVGGALDLYLANWKKMLETIDLGNKLMNENLEVLSTLDSGYKQINILNDGVIGFEGEYHQGWLLSSVDDLHIRFSTQNLKNARQISLRFLLDKKHRIYPPEKIIVYKDDTIYKEIILNTDIDRKKLQVEEIVMDTDMSDAESFSIKMVRRKNGKSTLACDEIRII